MNKKSALLAMLLLPMALASCADTSELFPNDAYIDSAFVKNRYNLWDKGLKEARHVATFPLTNEESAPARYFNGSGLHDSVLDAHGYDQAKSWHPSAFLNSRGEDLRWEPDIVEGSVGQWRDQSPLYDVAYGQSKKLTRINSKFGRGYLSKLYNGQVRCNAWSSYSLVEIDKSGYGTLFPAELEKAPYFAMSLRGGSDTAGANPRLSRFDINVTLYKLSSDNVTYEGTTFAMKDAYLQTNYSAEYTSLLGFYFNEIGGDFNPAGVVGMSVDFKMVEDFAGLKDNAVPTSDDFDDNAQFHTGLCLLEVLFPDSTWN